MNTIIPGGDAMPERGGVRPPTVDWGLLPRGATARLRRIGREARRMGSEAWLVGGIVRDLLLGRPGVDLDIVVEGDAVALGRRLVRVFAGRLRVHPAFGTATILLEDGRIVDLARCRTESYPKPGALPVVRPGRLIDDLRRRDFTINTMSLSIMPEDFGRLVDPYGGWDDLRRGVIRVLHEASFRDDPTRILRAIRFEQRFGFRLSRTTRRALVEALEGGAWKTVKGPRYYDAFRKLLREDRAGRCLLRLGALGGVDFLGPLEPVPAAWRRMDERRRLPLWRTADADPAVCGLCELAAAVTGDRPARWDAWVRTFGLNRMEKRALAVVPAALEAVEALRPRPSPSLVRDRLAPLPSEVVWWIWLRSIDAVRVPVERFLTKDRHVRLEVGGEDLRRLGCPDGRRMRRILDALLREKIDGRLPTRAAELRMARDMLQ